ncbi:embryonic polarity protein dorsal-like isoform X3 [Rhynchophorus ferrugineus]|uniref:embryonic polarity protein dorsal-like isoform X3 n=1 Tax=Rhynchophorus ferrugineus TaxID=354439 RepID=UPI003FCCE832
MDESEIDNANDESFDDTQLSDVIGVLENDPDFASPVVPERSFPLSMLNGGGQIPAPPKPSNPGANRRRKGYVRIIEQPASKALRFRYECEGRSAGSIPGVSSTPENKTYPEIQVEGYQGPAVVVVSCVMKDYPYAVHPHNLVGREGCKKGVCTLQIPEDTMRVQFSNLGIQCVKKRDIEASLRQREEIRVDPFRQHYHHKNQPTSIDLNAVRLCFQVFLQGDCTNKYNVPLDPVVSDIIYDKKAMSDLSIVKLSDCVSYVDGGRKDIILLCEKVAKEDIEIHFYELENDKKVWEAKADFQPSQVHKQHAIWFRTPRYKKLDVTEPVKVFIQLFRPSDQVRSEPLPFELLPINAVCDKDIKRKRPKFDQAQAQIMNRISDQDRLLLHHTMNTPLMEPIKTEPRDTTSPYGGSYGIMFQGASPNYAPSPAVSPQYLEMAPTPSPENINYIHYRQQPINTTNFPNMLQPIKTDQPTCSTWNIPTDPVHLPKPNAAAVNSYLDLDNHQISSGELVNTINDMNMPVNQLMEINNLSLTDLIPTEMSSDSLTNIVNDAAKNLL